MSGTQPVSAHENITPTQINNYYSSINNSATNNTRAVGHRTSTAPASEQGNWTEVMPWPVLAVHAALLPTGLVLAWDATPDDFDDDPHTSDNITTRVTVWNPTNNQHKTTNNNTGADLFCAGSAHLWDGRVVFAGGDSGRAGRNGPLANSNIYNPWENTWSQTDYLAAPRWYSSVAALPNGELLTFGGTYSPTPIAEVFQFNKQWRGLSISTPYTFSGDYSWLQANSEGSVSYLGPHNLLAKLETEEQGKWYNGKARDTVEYRGYGSYALFTTDKALITGGENSTNSSVISDLKFQQTSSTSPMNYGRRQHNLTILSDGSVLATGGNSSGEQLIDIDNPVLTPEIWSPDTQQWTIMNDMLIDRQYHSVALLLPDGRVLSAGGGYCAKCGEVGYFEQNAEIFSPPYLFDEDSQPASRPVITEVPEVINYATNFTLTTPQAADIKKAHLIKLGSVTHSQNQDQRLVPLDFQATSGALSVGSPANRNLAPPGHYMVIIVDNAGVPSVGSIVQIGQPLITSNEVVVNRTRPNKWDYYEIEGKGEHKLTVHLRGDTQDLDLFVKANALPNTPANPSGFFDCLDSSGHLGGKICTVTATSDTQWYIGVISQKAMDYSLIASQGAPTKTTLAPNGSDSINAPSAPLNLRSQRISNSAVELFWDASTDDGFVEGYEVYRNGHIIRHSDGTSMTENALQAGLHYSYEIVAIDNNGNRSNPSNLLVVDIPIDPNIDLDSLYHPLIPTTPQGLRQVTYSDTTAELFWQYSIDDNYILGYEIYRDDVLIDFVNGVSYYISGLPSNASYHFYVIAVDNERNRSPASNTTTVYFGDQQIPETDEGPDSEVVDTNTVNKPNSGGGEDSGSGDAIPSTDGTGEGDTTTTKKSAGFTDRGLLLVLLSIMAFRRRHLLPTNTYPDTSSVSA